MSLPERAERSPAPRPQDAPSPSEQERLAALVKTLRNLGWHVKLSSRGIAIHVLAPDGTPTSLAAACIRRKVGIAAPWTVMAPGLARARSFGSLDHAIFVFLRQAAEHAPAARRRPRTR